MLGDNYEELYRSLFSANRDAVIFFNKSVIVDANKAALQLFEVSRDEFVGREITEFTLDPALTRKRVKDRLNGVSEFYSSTISAGESVKEIEVSTTPIILEGITSYSIVRDVTEKNQLERRYRTIFERSADLILVTDEASVVFINPSGLEYLGLSSEDEIVGQTILNFLHPDSRETASEFAALRRSGGDPPSQYRVKMLRKDGKVLDVEFNASFIDWEGTPSSLTIVRDISEQVFLENQLLENRERLSGFIEAATDGFSILDSNMHYIMVNDTELRFTGRKREEYIGKHILDVFPNLKDTGRYQAYVDVLKTGKPIEFRSADIRPELNMVVDFSAFKAGDVLGIVARDVTEHVIYQRRLEALHSHANQLSQFNTKDEISDSTMEIIRETLGFRIGSFGYVEKEKVVFTAFREKSTITELDLTGTGITVRAVTTGETQLVNDTRNDPDYISGRVSKNEETFSEMDVPVIVDGQVIALINLESNEVDAFSQEDRRIVETLAAYVASALHRIDYEYRLRSLHEFSLSINKLDSIDQIAQETIKTVERVFKIPFTSFGVVEGDVLHFKYSLGFTLPQGYNLPLSGRGVTVRAVKTGETQVIWDITKDPDYILPAAHDPVTNEPVSSTSEVVVPVFVHNRPVGIINMESDVPGLITEDSVQLLELLGEHVSARLTALQYESERLRAEHAEEMERLKSRFVSTATHELRTPLTIMKGFLELAQEERDIDKVQTYLDVTARNTERLEKLINDLLDQQRIEEGRMEIDLQQLDLGLLLLYALEEVSGIIERKEQKVIMQVPDSPVMVTVDELRLGQVLVNLVDNASKYSPPRSEITICIEVEPGAVKVSVTDQGIGIRPEDIELLFTPFPNIDTPVVSEPSVGLGLSICKGFIELHDGDIWAESDGLGEGSTFTFTLPIKEISDY